MRQVAAAVIEKDGKILIAQRKQGDALAGKWEFPGGKLEPGETPEVCLRRELREEFGVETRIGAFICASKFEYKHLPIELLAYRVEHLAGEFKLNDHDSIAWVTGAELGNYDFAGADLPVVELLAGGPSIAAVAGTLLRLCGAPEGGLEPGAAAPDARVLARAPAGGVKKLLVYAPDAIGRLAIAKFPAAFAGLEAAGHLKFPVRSVFPSKTPVCFASMFSGLAPKDHGITQYARPVLKCKTVFDALPAHGLRTAIVAVKDSSIDLIFRGRRADYYSEAYDAEVTARALALIEAGAHDFILAYHQEYDDTLHAADPWDDKAQAAIARHLRAFGELAAAFDKKWRGVPRAVLFAPDHGAHTDPATGRGTHGDDIPDDMDVAHFWKFS